MSMSFEIIGIDRVKVILERVSQGMDTHLAKALDKIAENVKKDAQAICPVGTPQTTGNPNYIISHALQRSIRKETVARPGGNVWEIGVRAGGYIVNPNSGKLVDYAVYVEYGSSDQAPQGFLRPAMIQNQTAIKEAITNAVKDNIAEAKK